jgi:hypothetical protein
MMTICGIDRASGSVAHALAILDEAGAVQMVIDRDAFNALNASRKGDREGIAWRLLAIVERHGAQIERHESRGEITLRLSLGGVGALIHIDAVHGGNRALIAWHNIQHPARNFTARFCRMVGDLPKPRLHHKATSCPSNWYSLAMLLDAGLCLAARGEAFQAFDL